MKRIEHCVRILMVLTIACFQVNADAAGGKRYPENPYRPDNPEVVAVAFNPDPETYPTLSLRLHSSLVTFIDITFPNVPESIVSACVYEETNANLRFDFVEVVLLTENKLTLRHRLNDMPFLNVITTFTAEPGAAQCEATLQIDPEWEGRDVNIPDQLRWPNICWSSSKSPKYAPGGRVAGWSWSKEDYYDWIGRCFIFTGNGLTHLDKTRRVKTVEVPEDDERNSPPLHAWSQHYKGTWQPDQPTPQNVSPDTYTIPLLGAVSSDDRHLIALASDWTDYTAQAWGACFHHIPRWAPENKPLLERSFRMKLYGMKNDPGALLKRAKTDFPDAAKRMKKQVKPDPDNLK
jgi:hypothetical protein